MVDLAKTIEPKSDQTNADDLLGGPRTIEITGVVAGPIDQPIWISYANDKGRPYKPCKSMRRLLVHMWGGDGDKYAGRSLTLFCDPTVTFGPDAVGGIRISHMSDIARDETVMLTASRGKKKPYQVRRLEAPKPTKQPGNINQARPLLETADEATVDTIRKPLLEMSWSREEKQELAALVNSARARKRPAPKVVEPTETEPADEFASA